MSTRTFSALAAHLILGACTSIPMDNRQKEAFSYNNSEIRIAADDFSRFGKSWDESTGTKITSTKVPAEHRQWTLNFIAYANAQGVSPCRALELTSITELPLGKFIVQSPNSGPKYMFEPVTYYENWLVAACGKKSIWRVFDESRTKLRPPTIILWQDVH